MTGHDDFDRTLAGWFEADALSPAPADGLDRILEATRRRRPRPAWLAGPGGHWVGEAQTVGSSSGARSLSRLGLRWSTALILLLVIAALLGGAILVGARLFQPPPLPISRLGHLAVRPRRRYLRGRLGRHEPGPDRGWRSGRWRRPSRLWLASGERDRCGRPTGGTSRTGLTAVPGPQAKATSMQ